jgi:hypothetical protein
MRFTIPLLLAAACAAQTPNLTGTWVLNPARSSWGAREKPVTITLQIEHKEPVIRYNGLVVDVYGDGRAFQYEATLDGKAHPFRGPYGEGAIVFRRLDATTTTSLFRSRSGTIVEESKTSVTRDGKVLTHRVCLKDPNGEVSWTEVYDRR